MAKRVFGLGILAIVLIFGVMATGCDNGNGNGNISFDGTWIRSDGLERLVLSGDNYTHTFRDVLGAPWVNDTQGTFAVNLTYGTVVFTIRQEWIGGSWVNIPAETFSGRISVVMDNIIELSGFGVGFQEYLHGTWTRQ